MWLLLLFYLDIFLGFCFLGVHDMLNKKIVLASIFSAVFVSNAANAEITMTWQKNLNRYDTTSFTNITGEMIVQDSGIEYSSDHDMVVLLGGRALDLEIVNFDEGLKEYELMLVSTDDNGDAIIKKTPIKFVLEDIDNPIIFSEPAEMTKLHQSGDAHAEKAIDFARKYNGLSAEDGIAYATFDGKQYMDVSSIGLKSGILRIMDTDGDIVESEISYDVIRAAD